MNFRKTYFSTAANFFLALILIHFNKSEVLAQATINLPTNSASEKSIIDFGANGADALDDTWAFIKAGKYFSNQWDINGDVLPIGQLNIDYTTNSAVLYIPSGIYKVGKMIDVGCGVTITNTYKQIFGDPLYGDALLKAHPTCYPPNDIDSVFKFGLELMQLSNVNQMKIIGIGSSRPIIQYNDGLYCGLFYCNGDGAFSLPGASYASVGSFIEASTCQNLDIENLEIDGRNDSTFTKYDGGEGAHRIQTGASGIYLKNTKNITLKNMYIHHMTFDGIMLKDNYTDSSFYAPTVPLTNLTIDSTVCEYNRRTGFAWLGGRHIIVTNSKFNHSSYSALPNIAIGNPSTGMDIEPEDETCTSQLLYNIDGTFTNCEFVHNWGQPIGNDLNPSRTKHISFNECIMWDGDLVNYMLLNGEDYTLNSCHIQCSVLKGNRNGHPNIFNNCYFSDSSIISNGTQFSWLPVDMNIPSDVHDYLLVSDDNSTSLGARGTKFNSCTFTVNDSNRAFMYYTNQLSLLYENDFPLFKNCTFYQNNAGNTIIGSTVNFKASKLFGAIFDGNTSIFCSNPNAKHEWCMAGIEINGSTASCSPFNFEANGNIMLTQKGFGGNFSTFGRNGISSITDGYLNVLLKNNAIWKYDNGPAGAPWCDSHIGENARIIVEDEGTFANVGHLSAFGNLNIYGKLIVKENGHILFGSTIVHKSSKSLVYIDQLASIIKPFFWYGPPSPADNDNFYHYNFATPPCIFGEHTAMPPQAIICSPDYNQVHTDINGLIIVYKVSNNSLCWNNINEQIDLVPSGGVPPYHYSIDGGASFTNNYATLTSSGTHTLTLTDYNGCSTSMTFDILSPPPITWGTPTITNLICSGGGTGEISINATGGTGTITYLIQPIGATNTTGVFGTLSAQTYTVQATDANGCSINTSFTITEPPQVSWTSISSTNVLCNGVNTGSASVTANGGTGTITYLLQPIGATNTTGIFGSLSAQTYTVQATDANGCSITTSITVSEPATLLWSNTSFTNVLCGSGGSNGTITVDCIGGTSPYNYTISPSIGSSAPSGPTGRLFNGLTAQVYTIVSTDAHGCSITTQVEVYAPSSEQCLCNAGLVATPNMILKSSPLSSDILNLGTGGIVTNKQFFIDGQYTIDLSITMNLCTLNFTQSGSILLSPSQTFNMNTTTLQAGCEWWGGIVEANSSNKLGMHSNSVLRQSIYGIHALNDALLEIEDSRFEDNRFSDLYLSNITLNPNPSYIKRNTFTTINPLPSPYLKTEVGIELVNVKDLNIGDLADPNSGNHFSNIYTGIWIHNQLANGSNRIGIYNNDFSNINAPDLSTSTTTNEIAIVNNSYLSKKGAGIYSDFGGFPTYNSNIDVRNYSSVTSVAFNNCDKAISSIGAALRTENLNINNCLLGVMCSSPFERAYYMRNNTIMNSHIGIELFGKHDRSDISFNNITTGYGIPKQYGPVRMNAPTGIKVQFGTFTVLPSTVYKHTIANNTINVRAIVGTGIYKAFGDSRMYTGGNNVSFTTNSTSSSSAFNSRALFGYYIDGCNGSTLEENTTVGVSNQSVWQQRDSKGMYFSQGPNCKINCNKAKFTTYGFYVWGDNNTKKELVSNNKFNANKYPWYFMDNASAAPGTFGNVGAVGTDNRNNFLYNGGGGAINWLNSGPFKVFRFSTSPTQNKIYTDQILLTSAECGSNIAGNWYIWQDATMGPTYLDPCIYDPNFIINPGDSGEDSGFDTELDHSLAIAQDSLNYINFPIVGGWIDKRRLYDQLDADVELRNSNIDLLLFYNNYSSQTIGDLHEADLAMQILSDSNINDAEFVNRYNEALNKNYSIVSPDSWEMNEQQINLIDLKLIRFGLDSIANDDKVMIHTLANSCPFIEGTSVYKARVLWSNFEPDAMYDDRVICIAGQNKNQSNENIDIDSLYESQIQQSFMSNSHQMINSENFIEPRTLNGNEIKIYPNPTTDFITIFSQCKKDGVFILFNNLGQEVYRANLNGLKNQTKLRIPQLVNGVYNYKCEFNDCANMFGKLTILK